MEETIKEFEEKCYVSTADHRTYPQKAFKKLIKGKENLEFENYALAVQELHYAKEIYDEYYGKMANECGEVYFFFGKALCLLSLEEIYGPIHTKVKGETSEFMKEAGFSPQEVSLDVASCLKCRNSVTEEIKMEENSIITKQWLSDYHRKLAWKFLEDAKLIFERQDAVKAELKVAETLQLLADIYIAKFNYPYAIEEYKRSLKIYEKHLVPDDRILADVYAKIGHAYIEIQMYPEALKYYQNIKRTFEMEFENLKNIIVDADGICKYEVECDISDLHILLGDIQTVIEDTEKQINDKKEVMET